MISDKKHRESILLGGVFLLFLIISTYKLTNASLWFDESIEYWYSKIMVGELPFESSGTVNMYQRIISTFQPPLYNVLMYFWLKISDSVWWFRFFGVVMGFIGMIGLYKAIFKATGNSYLASCSVAFATFVYQLLYYWQECAEYCIMLAGLFWTLYYWIAMIKEPNRKNLIGFTISAIIPIYSQYGSAFPVVIMGASLLIITWIEKNKKNLVDMIVAFGTAIIFAGIPLYVFFLKQQMNALSGSRVSIADVNFEGGMLKDHINSFQQIFKWNLMSYYSDTAVQIFLVLILIMVVLVLIKGSKLSKNLILVNIFIWELYYLTVKLGIYSYGNFGNRYNTFFIPVWIVTFFVLVFEVYQLLGKVSLANKFELQYIFTGSVIAFCLCFCFFSWNARIQNNWTKEEARNVTEEWIKQTQNDKDTKTLIYYGANSGFAYYIRADENFDESWENNVTYMPWFRSKSEEQWNDYLNATYGSIWPDQLYVVATHINENDLDILSKQFTDKGYERTDIYKTRGFLLKFSR